MNDACGTSRGKPHTQNPGVPPSGTTSSGITGDPSPPLVPPTVSPTKPTRFTTQTPTKVWTRAYLSDIARFQSLVRKLARSGLVASTGIDLETAKCVGGRPPVVAGAFRVLLDNVEALSRRPRAARGPDRIRRVDDAVRVEFGCLFGHFPTRLLPYRPSVERVAGQATGADRPQRRIAATVGFCERRLIAGLTVGQGTPAQMDPVLLTMVPHLPYGWGATVYQTTLAEDGSVAA